MFVNCILDPFKTSYTSFDREICALLQEIYRWLWHIIVFVILLFALAKIAHVETESS